MESSTNRKSQDISESGKSRQDVDKTDNQGKAGSAEESAVGLGLGQAVDTSGVKEDGAENDADLGLGLVVSGTGTAGTVSSSLKDIASTYQVRPNLRERFRPAAINEMIHEVLHEELTGKVYSTEESEELTTKIANLIRDRVKEMALNRYKYMVQVVLAEQRGAGIVMGMRCLWDAETDSYASNQFLSDTIYGMAVVFAVYFY